MLADRRLPWTALEDMNGEIFETLCVTRPGFRHLGNKFLAILETSTVTRLTPTKTSASSSVIRVMLLSLHEVPSNVPFPQDGRAAADDGLRSLKTGSLVRYGRLHANQIVRRAASSIAVRIDVPAGYLHRR